MTTSATHLVSMLQSIHVALILSALCHTYLGQQAHARRVWVEPPDECYDISALTSSTVPFDTCFTDQTRLSVNAGVYFGLDAYNYLRAGGTGIDAVQSPESGNSFLSLVTRLAGQARVVYLQKAASEQDVAWYVLGDIAYGYIVRTKFLSGKISNLELLWNHRQNRLTTSAVKAVSRAGIPYLTSLCSSYGVNNTITYEEFNSLPATPAEDAFLCAKSAQCCKYLHLIMFPLTIETNATNPNHCVHGSLSPRPDSNGIVKCVDNYVHGYDNYTLFTPRELQELEVMTSPSAMAVYMTCSNKASCSVSWTLRLQGIIETVCLAAVDRLLGILL